jgi:hypothetical protein
MKKALKRVFVAVGAACIVLVGAELLFAQSVTEVIGNLVFRGNAPKIQSSGTLTIETLAGTDMATFDASGNQVLTGDVTVGDDVIFANSDAQLDFSLSTATTTRIIKVPAIANVIVTPGATTALASTGYILVTVAGTPAKIALYAP